MQYFACHICRIEQNNCKCKTKPHTNSFGKNIFIIFVESSQNYNDILSFFS